MAFGLRIRRASRSEIASRVREVAELLGLSASLKKKPAHLSGGQRQRVAMGRAIVREPTIYLMDEPLSNLDAQLRVEMRAEIARLQRRLGVTTVYVTHDQTEAMVLGDRVAVLKDGLLQQHATPGELYGRPANAFVARFIGSPSMNLFEGTLEQSPEATVVSIGQFELVFPRGSVADGQSVGPGRHRILCGIRPEALEEGSGADLPGRPRVRGVVELREELGPELFVYVDVDGAPPALGGFVDDEAASDHPPIEASSLTVARLGPRSRLREGDRVELAVDPAGVHFFDAVTHRRLD
jgi:multiple sugar transport system ATP-binding protein